MIGVGSLVSLCVVVVEWNVVYVDLFVCGLFDPLSLLFKALLHGKKDSVFFSVHLMYILQQEHFRAFRPAWAFKSRALWSVSDGKGLMMCQ
jgi:hypothetical protein